MPKDIKNMCDPTDASESGMVSISVPARFEKVVQAFVRQLESEDEDTRAHMLSLLTTTSDELTIRKRVDQTTPELS